MKKLLLMLLLLAAAHASYAQKKTFTREYTYRASENDSRNSARDAAVLQLQKLLLMEIGQLLQAEQTLKKMSVTRDGRETFSESFSQEVRSVTAGFVEMKIIDEDWDGKTYYIAARMTVDPKEVSRRVAEALENKQREKEREAALQRERERELALQREREEQNKREQQRLAAEKQRKEIEKQRELEAIETVTFWDYRFSVTANYGFLFGVCKRWGGYMQYSGSMNGVSEGDLKAYEAYERERKSDYSETIKGEPERDDFRSSFTMGGMMRYAEWLHLYAGLGYGKYGATYCQDVEITSYSGYGVDRKKGDIITKYHYYCPYLIKGLELEAGAIFTYGNVNASIGYSTIAGVKVRELHFGLGFTF